MALPRLVKIKCRPIATHDNLLIVNQAEAYLQYRQALGFGCEGCASGLREARSNSYCFNNVRYIIDTVHVLYYYYYWRRLF